MLIRNDGLLLILLPAPFPPLLVSFESLSFFFCKAFQSLCFFSSVKSLPFFFFFYLADTIITGTDEWISRWFVHSFQFSSLYFFFLHTISSFLVLSCSHFYLYSHGHQVFFLHSRSTKRFGLRFFDFVRQKKTNGVLYSPSHEQKKTRTVQKEKTWKREGLRSKVVCKEKWQKHRKGRGGVEERKKAVTKGGGHLA